MSSMVAGMSLLGRSLIRGGRLEGRVRLAEVGWRLEVCHVGC